MWCLNRAPRREKWWVVEIDIEIGGVGWLFWGWGWVWNCCCCVVASVVVVVVVAIIVVIRIDWVFITAMGILTSLAIANTQTNSTITTRMAK